MKNEKPQQSLFVMGSPKYLGTVMSVLMEKYGDVPVADILEGSPNGQLTYIDPFMQKAVVDDAQSVQSFDC